MAFSYALINKESLSYICRGKCVSNEYLVERVKIKTAQLEKWLDVEDKALPTIKQAKRISRVLHIPFAALYMNPCDIPLQKIPTIKNLRTMQGISSEDSSLNIAIGDILLEREYLISVNKELGVENPLFSVHVPTSTSCVDWVNAIRRDFQINLREQFQCSTTRQFYLYLRECLEKKGVFVHCFKDTPVEVARGVAIYNEIFPIIGINDEDRYPAKSFSMIHELVHLYKRESVFCNDLTNQSVWMEEVFCNAVAGELLVPKNNLGNIMVEECMVYPYVMQDIETLAHRFSVSREVIIRRLLDCKKINEEEYSSYVNELQREYERSREERKLAKENGIKTTIPRVIYREAFDRTSLSVSKALYKGLQEELLSKRDIANHLGIAQKHVDRFLTEVAKWSN